MKINITKRFLLSLCLMTLTLLCGENKAWGQAKSTLTFTKACGGSGTADDGVKWTVTSDASETTYESSRGIHYGSGSIKVSYLKLSTSKITGVVQKIVVNASGASGTSAKLDVTVNGKSFGNQKTITSTAKDYTFEGTGSGEIIVKLSQTSAKKALYVKSISVTYQKATTPTLKPSSTSLTFPQIEVNTSSSQTFTLSGENLTGDATLSLSGTNPDLFNVTPTTVTTTDGAITNETVTVTYTPTETGTHTATLTISSDGANEQKITLNGTAYQIYNVNWKVNGADYTEGKPTTKVESENAVTNLPTAPSAIAGRTFVGWTNAEITTSSATAPPTLFTKAANAPAVTSDVTYYAVFASASGTGETSEELTGEEIVKLGTLDYDTEKTYYGTNLSYNIYGYKNGSTRPWIQIKAAKGSYIKITAPKNITKVDLIVSSVDNSSGGSDDINMHDAFTGKIGLVTKDVAFSTSTVNIGSAEGDQITNNKTSITTTSGTKVLYIKSSKSARIWGITTYFSDLTYSNYATTVPLSFSFSDTEDLKASLPTTSPLADQTVTLDRYLYSGWNTFCVPFALTQEQLEGAYGNGAVAKYLSDVTIDGAAVTLHFAPENGGGIEANKAYLLYLTDDVTEAKTFSGVTLQPAGDCTTTVSAAGGNYSFKGILAPTALETNDRQYFLNSTGTYFVLPLDNTSQLKATRAYIIVPTPAGSAQGRQYSFDFNGTTTAIDNVTISGMEDGAWYTISGIRVNRPAAKGVYIHNGRKVIVK